MQESNLKFLKICLDKGVHLRLIYTEHIKNDELRDKLQYFKEDGMLKITVFNEDKARVKKIIEKNSFFNTFDITEVEDGFVIDGMKYCTIADTYFYGEFTLFGDKDKALADVISEGIKEIPEVEVKGSLLLGDDKYRQYYWMHSASGTTEVTVDYAINVDEYFHEKEFGEPLSSAWYYCYYYTNYGTEFIYFNSIDDLRNAVESAISYFDIEEDDKLLGLESSDIIEFMDAVMGTSVDFLEDLELICSEISKKYENEDTFKDKISGIIVNNMVPMAKAINELNAEDG